MTDAVAAPLLMSLLLSKNGDNRSLASPRIRLVGSIWAL